ncbi:MAG: hypothetical protein ACYTEQ_16740 [Planctomycetota bacterium]|jgi:hypothetical protein
MDWDWEAVGIGIVATLAGMLLVVAVVLLFYGGICIHRDAHVREGTIEAKCYEKARFVAGFPAGYYRDEAWVLYVRGPYKGKPRNARVEVPENIWEATEVGDYFER